MMFFSALIFISFIIFQNCNAFFLFDDLQLLSGPCPKVQGKMDFQDVLDGKWYVHWSIGKYSPWSYLQCHFRRIYLNNFGNPQTIMTRSKLPLTLPFIDNKFEFTGYLYALNDDGQFIVEYFYRCYFILLCQLRENSAILYTHPDGAALMWNCFDFKDFHLASFMTKSTDPNDSKISKKAREGAEAKIEQFKIGTRKMDFQY